MSSHDAHGVSPSVSAHGAAKANQPTGNETSEPAHHISGSAGEGSPHRLMVPELFLCSVAGDVATERLCEIDASRRTECGSRYAGGRVVRGECHVGSPCLDARKVSLQRAQVAKIGRIVPKSCEPARLDR